MPKPGFSILIVSETVKKRLEEVVKAEGYRSVNQLLEAWLRANPGVYPASKEEIAQLETNGGSMVKAPPGGLEPPTNGLTARCSTELSYGGIASVQLLFKAGYFKLCLLDC